MLTPIDLLNMRASFKFYSKDKKAERWRPEKVSLFVQNGVSRFEWLEMAGHFRDTYS